MKNREIIYESLKLIENNLKSDMTVYAISQHYNYSLYYFSKLFKGVTGFSPKSYILNRKISESVKDVLESDKKIIEIAFDYGFSNPESYSRAFNKFLGI
ncbi:MAG: helix-turn-helix transcriptional regulator, partial [bacterium]|nr:helix-turn-helix transcriptional regulator [bacterium]